MISSLKQPAASIVVQGSSDFLGSRRGIAAAQCLPSLGPGGSRRLSAVSVSKPLHITSFERKQRWSPITCAAYEADRSEPVPAPTPSESARKVKIGIYFATWWGLNVIFNIYNKKVLNAYPYPWLTSTLSLAAGSIIMLISWALRIAETPKTDLDFWKSLLPVRFRTKIAPDLIWVLVFNFNFNFFFWCFVSKD